MQKASKSVPSVSLFPFRNLPSVEYYNHVCAYLSAHLQRTTLMYISPLLQKTDESSTLQRSVKVSANAPCVFVCVCVCVCDSAFAPSCFHWFRRELNSVYANEVAFKHMPRTIILKQVFSCTKTRQCSVWVKYLATNMKPSWGDRGEMSQLVCHLACWFAPSCKHDTQESLCSCNNHHNNKKCRLCIKDLSWDD